MQAFRNWEYTWELGPTATRLRRLEVCGNTRHSSWLKIQGRIGVYPLPDFPSKAWYCVSCLLLWASMREQRTEQPHWNSVHFGIENVTNGQTQKDGVWTTIAVAPSRGNHSACLSKHAIHFPGNRWIFLLLAAGWAPQQSRCYAVVVVHALFSLTLLLSLSLFMTFLYRNTSRFESVFFFLNPPVVDVFSSCCRFTPHVLRVPRARRALCRPERLGRA